MTSFHLKRFSGRPTKGPWPSFFTTLSIRYTCCCEQKQRADNGSDVIFSLDATKSAVMQELEEQYHMLISAVPCIRNL